MKARTKAIPIIEKTPPKIVVKTGSFDQLRVTGTPVWSQSLIQAQRYFLGILGLINSNYYIKFRVN